MINATQLMSLVPDGGSLSLTFIKTKAGLLTVIIDPKLPIKDIGTPTDAEEAVKKAMAPRIVTGTPEELDGQFMTLIGSVVETKSNLISSLESLKADTDAALKKAKEASLKKVEGASKTKPKSGTPAASSEEKKKTEEVSQTEEPKPPALAQNTLSLF